MNYFLTEEQQMLKELAQKITEEKIIPKRAELDETEEFPRDILDHLGQSDLFGIYIPEEYGGMGLGGCFENCLVMEELSRGCGGVAVSYAASALGAYPILLYGSEELKKKYLPDIASGKKLGAYAITEANAGSDAGSIQTTAERKGEHYILNGTKQWITNGGEAEIYSIFALTDKSKGSRGASAFVVEKDTPGFSFGKKEKKMGIRCSATRELIFEDCKISKDNLIGKEGIGFIVAMKTFDVSRPSIGAQAVGIAQAALEESFSFSKERVQFGKPVSSIQAVQHMLADMATQIEAARALVYSAAKFIDSNPKNFARESAMAKLFASDMCMDVTTQAVQVMGGHGYMRDYPLEKMMRDAKITQIYEGTNQIQRNIIALSLIRKGARN